MIRISGTIKFLEIVNWYANIPFAGITATSGSVLLKNQRPREKKKKKKDSKAYKGFPVISPISKRFSYFTLPGEVNTK